MNNGVKLTRTQLKGLVKECLVEILQEGLGVISPTRAEPMGEFVRENRQVAKPVSHRPRSASLDTPVSKRALPPSLLETIKHEANGNSVMADILADTAMTTLPKMLSSGDSSNSQPSSRVMQVEHFQGSPEQVFGDEVASRWANLAFMDAPSRKMS